jgi:drug/metabolite transporter (DMT)-like permease
MFSNQETNVQHARRGNQLLVIVAFACIYIIWGSTYLAIRYAVETIPPLFVASFRHFIAGAIAIWMVLASRTSSRPTAMVR